MCALFILDISFPYTRCLLLTVPLSVSFSTLYRLVPPHGMFTMYALTLH